MIAGPKELMAEAQTLVGKKPGEALDLLMAGLGKWESVPPAYDLLLGRASLAAGRPEAAIEHLQRASVERAQVPPNLHKVLGDAMLDLGREHEAGGQYAKAIEAGASIGSMTTKQKLALQDFGRSGGELPVYEADLDNQVLSDFCVYDSAHRVALTYIPKVACSVFKATVVMNSPNKPAYLKSGKPIHDFCHDERKDGASIEPVVAADVFRFTVLREPAARILSAYLNKFVRGGPNESPGITRDKNFSIREAQKLAGIPFDLARGITFEEFANFLATASDLQMNLHWMPQHRFVGPDLGRYHHVGRFETLDDSFALLEQKFGYVCEKSASVHLGGSKNNTSVYNPDVVLDDPHRRLPHELRALKTGYPMPEAFLPPQLRATLLTRYALDAALHAAAP